MLQINLGNFADALKTERELTNFAGAYLIVRRQQNPLIRVKKILVASEVKDKFTLRFA
jgi:hypothetical protein